MVHAAVKADPVVNELSDAVGIEAFQRLKGNAEFGHSITKPSASFFLVSQGERLSGSQRLSLSRLVRDKFAGYDLYPELEQLSSQILPPGTFGSLDSPPAPTLPPGSAAGLPKKVRFVATNPTMPMAQAIVRLMKDAGIEVDVADFGSDLSQADVVLRGQGIELTIPRRSSFISPWSASGHQSRRLRQTKPESCRSSTPIILLPDKS